ASDVTVSGNAWQTDAQWPSNGSSVCEVVAVPAGTVPANEGDLAGRSGALVYPGYFTEDDRDGKAFNYYASMSATNGYFDAYGFGDYAVDASQLVFRHEYDGWIFDGNADPRDSDPADNSQPNLRIDGKPAYPVAYIGANSSLADLPGWTGVTWNLADE